jgi:hypothetical protein
MGFMDSLDSRVQVHPQAEEEGESSSSEDSTGAMQPES